RAIQVATNVTVASITAASGSRLATNVAAKWPASNHVTGPLRDETGPPGAPATWTSAATASTAAAAKEAIAGRWASRHSGPSPISQMRTAAASGSARAASARMTGSGTG